jgi:hypothetical protein
VITLGKIHLVQLLCPQRHCVVAGAYPAGEITFEEVCHYLDLKLAAMGGKRRCGICGSSDLHFEDGVTRFQTMEEALPFLREEERKQALTRALIGNRY